MSFRAAVCLAFCASLAGAAQAGVYRCEKDGKITFSDHACEQAKVSKVDVGYSRFDAAEAHAAEKRFADARAQDFRERRQELVNEGYEQIDALEQERDAKLAVLQTKKRFASNNLAGATWEESISQEMSAVNEQYRQKIEDIRKNLARIEQ